MAGYPPPSENVPIFNSSLFSDDERELNINQLSNYFLRYPNAQGNENLQSVSVNGVATFNNKIVQDLGSGNQQIGDTLSLNNLTSGIGNQAIGTHSATSITSGDYNTTIGYYAGDSISTGSNNIAIGKSSQHVNNGTNNIAIGYESLFGQTNSSNSIAIGSNAMKATNDNYTNSVAIGSNAMQINSLLYKDNSVAIGNNAGQNNQNSSCVAIGSSAGNGTQGEYCVAIGRAAGLNNQGSGGIAIGYAACQTNQGIDSIGIGDGCECSGTNGICIGAQTGKNGCGNNSIIIGTMNGGLDQSNNNARNIIINASGSAISTPTATDRCYITPIRNAVDTSDKQFIMQSGAGTEVVKISKTSITGPIAVITATSTSANPIISAQTTDAAAAGAYIEIYKNSVSPASADDIGGVMWSSTDSLGVKQLYSRIFTNIDDPITATVNGSIYMQCKFNGTDVNYFQVSGGDDTIRFLRSGSNESGRFLSNGCLDISTTALSSNAGTRLYVNGDIENIGSSNGLWLNATGVPFFRIGPNPSTTNGGLNSSVTISTGINNNDLRGSASTSGYIWRIANAQNPTSASALEVLRLQVGTAVLAGGGSSIITMGNATNNSTVSINGTLSTTGIATIGTTSAPVVAGSVINSNGNIEVMGSNNIYFNGAPSVNSLSSQINNLSSGGGKMQIFNRGGTNGGFLFRSCLSGSTPTSSRWNAISVDSISTVDTGSGGFFGTIFGNSNNNNNVQVIGSLSATGLFSVCNTYDPCCSIPFNNSSGGTQTILTQTFDPNNSTIIAPGISVLVANDFYGCAINLVNGVTYTGIQCYASAAAGNITAGLFTKAGVRLAVSSTIAIVANVPLNISFTAPYTSILNDQYVIGISASSTPTMWFNANNTQTFQTSVASTFNIRAMSLTGTGLPASLTGTPTNTSRCLWLSVY